MSQDVSNCCTRGPDHRGLSTSDHRTSDEDGSCSEVADTAGARRLLAGPETLPDIAGESGPVFVICVKKCNATTKTGSKNNDLRRFIACFCGEDEDETLVVPCVIMSSSGCPVARFWGVPLFSGLYGSLDDLVVQVDEVGSPQSTCRRSALLHHASVPLWTVVWVERL